MSRRSWTIVAAEVAFVGLLVLVVYLTLLRPDGESPLFDVHTPADRQPAEQAPTRGDRGRGPDGRRSGPGGRPDRGRAERARPRTFEAGEGAGRRGARALGPAPGTAPPVGVGSSPTDDQYLDTLARLDAQLNAPD